MCRLLYCGFVAVLCSCLLCGACGLWLLVVGSAAFAGVVSKCSLLVVWYVLVAACCLMIVDGRCSLLVVV